jgi:hypothetical protein
MALTAKEARRIRNAVERVANEKGVAQTWTKGEIDAAVEAIESRWDAAGTQSALSSDIETAAPGVFTVPQKKYLAAFWLIMRGAREKGAI